MEGSAASTGSFARQLMKDQGVPISELPISPELKIEAEPGGAPAAIPADAAAQPVTTPESMAGAALPDAPAAIPAPAAAQPAAVTPAVPKPAPIPAAVKAEPTDEEIFHILQQRHNLDIKSLEDLQKKPALTPQEIEEQKEADKGAALEYAIKNKKVDQKAIEAYATEKNTPIRDLALKIFGERLLATDKTLTPEDIEQKFVDYFNEDAEDGNWLKTMRHEEMQIVTEAYLNNKYANVLGIDTEYDNYKQTIARAESYRSQVTKAIETFPNELKFTVDVENADGKKEKVEYSYTYNPDIVEAVKKEFLSPDLFNELGARALDTKGMQEAINYSLMTRELPKIINEIAKSHYSAMLKTYIAGSKNIPDNTSGGTGQAANVGRKTGTYAQTLLPTS